VTASALNPTPGRGSGSAARTLPVSRAILYATLVVGLLDATDGVVFLGLHGQNPIQVLQYIASSLLGARSFSGGLATAGVGLVDLYPREPTHRNVAYAVGAPRIAVWCCRVGCDEPGLVAPYRGCSQPDHDCGVGQRHHRPRSVRRPAQRVFHEKGGSGSLNGCQKESNRGTGRCGMGERLQLEPGDVAAACERFRRTFLKDHRRATLDGPVSDWLRNRLKRSQ
jgi:hypothetical protein